MPQRLEPPGPTPPEKFGSNVVTDGRFWFVADVAARTLCSGSTLSCSTGAVHVYELVSDRLEYTQTIVPPDIVLGALFGAGLAVDAGRLLIGAPKHTTLGGVSQRGLVFVYKFDGASWVETGRVEAPQAVQQDFGKGIALHDDLMVVWPQSLDRVYLHVYDEGQWQLQQMLWAEPEARAWDFGRRMAIDDRWLFIAAPNDDTVTAGGGSVFVYEREPDGHYALFQKLAADFFGRFGTDIAFNGSLLLVGVPAYAPEFQTQGGVFVYAFDGSQWVLEEQVTLGPAARNDAFGWRIAVDGATMLVSAPGKRTPEGRSAVYQFEHDPAEGWREVRRLIPTPLFGTGDFGHEMVIQDGQALVTSLDEIASSGDGDGTAYLFDLTCDGVPCPADVNGDGNVDIFDYLEFLNAYAAGDPLADCDSSGILDVFDFFCFRRAFDAGC
jgi:hypothetical protein